MFRKGVHLDLQSINAPCMIVASDHTQETECMADSEEEMEGSPSSRPTWDEVENARQACTRGSILDGCYCCCSGVLAVQVGSIAYID